MLQLEILKKNLKNQHKFHFYVCTYFIQFDFFGEVTFGYADFYLFFICNKI